MMTEHSGGCLCGLVRYTTRGEPLWAGHCHCSSCRRHTGSAVGTFVGFKREQVTFASGDRALYASSPGVSRGFCARCGTPISYEAERFKGEIHLYIGTFDDPDAFVPAFHVHYGEHVAWFEINDALPRFTRDGRGEPASWGPLK